MGQSKEWTEERKRKEEEKRMRAEPDPLKSEQTKAYEELKNYQVSPFEFDTGNPYIDSMRRLVSQNQMQTGQDVTRALASRGALDSGQVMRAKGRMASEGAQNLQNIIGQDYQRQMAQWNADEANRYNRLLTGYGMAGDRYNQAKEEYYQKLALSQQQANDEYQRRMASGYDWGTGISGAMSGAKLGSKFGPWGTLIGGGLGLLAGKR